uniref:Uncharacterized protein n=1 Tax=Caliciviridae sp. TaxID=1916234 RepID=A0A6M9Z9Z0_9CALI|nr:MAG: hypothetical protein [Caliciviridae sp.]
MSIIPAIIAGVTSVAGIAGTLADIGIQSQAVQNQSTAVKNNYDQAMKQLELQAKMPELMVKAQANARQYTAEAMRRAGADEISALAAARGDRLYSMGDYRAAMPQSHVGVGNVRSVSADPFLVSAAQKSYQERGRIDTPSKRETTTKFQNPAFQRSDSPAGWSDSISWPSTRAPSVFGSNATSSRGTVSSTSSGSSRSTPSTMDTRLSSKSSWSSTRSLSQISWSSGGGSTTSGESPIPSLRSYQVSPNLWRNTWVSVSSNSSGSVGSRSNPAPTLNELRELFETANPSNQAFWTRGSITFRNPPPKRYQPAYTRRGA